MATRISTVRLDKAERTPQGFLRLRAFATRTGVLTYVQKDGTIRRELRPPSEVFAPASMETLKAIPLTDNHPDGLVTPQNATSLARGWTGETVSQSDKLLEVGVTIMDASLIERVESGIREVSCGYECDMELTAGQFEGQAYDCIQRNIRYNHLAIVPRGRAGSEVRLRFDAAEEILDEQGAVVMAKVNVNGVDLEVSEPVALALTDKLRKDGMTLDELSKKMDALQKELESLKGKNAVLEQENADSKKELAEMKADAADPAKIHERLVARQSVVAVAEKTLKAGEFKLDSMDELSIKKAIVAAKLPSVKLDSASVDMIEGAYLSVAANVASTPASTASTSTPSTRSDSAPVSSAEARRRAMERDTQAWKSK